MFRINPFRQIRPTRKMALVFFIAGLGLLIMSAIYAISVTKSFPLILSFFSDSLISINRKLGAVPEYDTRVYWYVSRSAAVTAYIILSFTIILGLIVTTKSVKKIDKLPPVYEMHKVFAIISILLGLTHSLILLGDNYFKFNLSNLYLPFSSPYRPIWVGIGVTGFYLMIVTVLSFYFRWLITFRGWRIWHYTTFITWIAITIHGIRSGTDTSTWMMRILYILSVTSVAFLTLMRLFMVFMPKRKWKRKYFRIGD